MDKNYMKRKFKKESCLLLLASLILSSFITLLTPSEAFASDPLTNHYTNWPQMTDISEDSAVLMDADSGAVLYSLDRDIKRFPASITKIMTCLLTLENADMTDTVTMTETGMEAAYGGSSNIQPVLGEQFTVEQCLYMLMLKSANDIAAQLAEYVGGSVDGFVGMMNARAAKLGCTGTHFHNPNGLPDEEHYTTAYDMALIMQECLKNASFRKIISTVTYTVPATNKTASARTYQNHCKLIVSGDTESYYPYCIGGKTGYTDAALRTLVGAAEKDGMTLIAVTMHGPTNQDFKDMAALFNYGFSNFTTEAAAPDADGKSASGSITLPRGFSLSNLTKEVTSGTDGKTVTTYSYEKNFMGKTVTEAGTVSAASPASVATVPQAGVSPAKIIFILAGAAVLFALVFYIYLRIQAEKKRRKRMEMLRRRRKMRAEREKSGENASGGSQTVQKKYIRPNRNPEDILYPRYRTADRTSGQAVRKENQQNKNVRAPHPESVSTDGTSPVNSAQAPSRHTGDPV